MLELFCFGVPRLRRDGAQLTVERRKGLALLVYLALSDGFRSRDVLATLLWPGYDQSTARTNLRHTLSALVNSLGSDWLEADRERISIKRQAGPWVDAVQFRRLLAGCGTHNHPAELACPACIAPLSEAVALCQDDFLAGFALPDAPDFDDWQRLTAESLRLALSGALGRLADVLAARGDLGPALIHARRRAVLDPLDEPGRRGLMRLLALSGDRAAALRQYGDLATVLRRDLGAGPDAETDTLRQAILENRLSPPQTTLPDPQLVEREPAPAPDLHPAETPAPPSLAVHQGELRLVSVLCAGPAGECEPDAIAEVMAWLIPAIEQAATPHGARIDRMLADSVVAVFGAVAAHEDDPERAVLAALDLICAEQGSSRAGRAIRIGLGVSTGEAYFGPVGGGDRPASVVGGVLSRAARLQAGATAGQVLVDQFTQDQTRGSYAYTCVAPTLRETAFALGAPRIRPVKQRGIEGAHAALAGRDRELALLREALARAAWGEGQIVVLTGEAGLGKSRLVAELKASPANQPGAQPLLWLEGRCREMTSSTPYGPFADLLRSYLAGDGRVPTGEALRSELRALVHSYALSEEQVEELGPLLGNLLSLQFGDDWDRRLEHADPAQIRHRTFAALELLVGALASRQPVVLVLEDLHWADALSIDLATTLAGLLPGQALLLLYVYRPGPEYPSGRIDAVVRRRSPGQYTELGLHPLSRGECQQMMASLLPDAEFAPALQDLILGKSQGNPFYVEEIVRSLIGAGVLSRVDGGAWRSSAVAPPLRVPEGVQGVIQGRLDRLPLAERSLLQIAAVLGPVYPQRVLAHLAPREVDVPAALGRLEQGGFVYLERTLPEETYAFGHVLIQETVYGTLTGAARAHLHRLAGESIELLYPAGIAEHTEELAYHFDRGEDSDGGAKAIQYLLGAGAKMHRSALYAEAIACFLRVLERTGGIEAADEAGPQGTVRLAALTGLGRAYCISGKMVDAEQWLRRAIALGRSLQMAGVELARLYFWLGDALYWQNRPDSVEAVVREGLPDVVHTPLGRRLLLTTLRSANLARGLPTRFDQQGFQVPELWELPYVDELRVAYICAINEAVRVKDLGQAAELVNELATRGREQHDLRGQGAASSKLATARLVAGEWADALGPLSEAREIAAKTGDVLSELEVLYELCSLDLALGHIDATEAMARRGISLYEGAELAWCWPLTCMYAFIGMTRLIRLEQPAEEVTRAIELVPTLPANMRGMLQEWIGWTCLAMGRRLEAAGWFREALAATRRVLYPYANVLKSGRAEEPLIGVLAGYEAACAGPAEFRSECDRVRSGGHPAMPIGLECWYLQEATPIATGAAIVYANEPSGGPQVTCLGRSWAWNDPSGDCSFDSQAAVMHAPAGRDLHYLNLTAPRLTAPVNGDLIAEVTLSGCAEDRPASGGLLLWADRDNYLLLAHGRRIPGEVRLEGCLHGVDVTIGRGRLPVARVHLRLERTGAFVRALVSEDGQTWLAAGRVEFTAQGPLQVGLCALGATDPMCATAGLYAPGAAVRFESFGLWAPALEAG